jgi:hypothetical protein
MRRRVSSGVRSAWRPVHGGRMTCTVRSTSISRVSMHFARQAVYLDLVIGVCDRCGTTANFDSGSMECAGAVSRSEVAISALVLCGKCDSLPGQLALSEGLEAQRRKLLRLGDPATARSAFLHSLSLRWTTKAFVGWLMSSLPGGQQMARWRIGTANTHRLAGGPWCSRAQSWRRHTTRLRNTSTSTLRSRIK